MSFGYGDSREPQSAFGKTTLQEVSVFYSETVSE